MTTNAKCDSPAAISDQDQLALMRAAMKFALRSRHNLDAHFLATRAAKMARNVPGLKREAVLGLMRELLLEIVEDSIHKAATARIGDRHDEGDDDGFGHGGH